MSDESMTKERLMEEIVALRKQIASYRSSDQKQIEISLEDANIEHTVILDNQIDHVVLQDLNHRILWANRAACDSVGLSREDIVGRYCHEVWAGRTESCEDCPVRKSVNTGNIESVEKTTPDGRTWYIRGCPIRNERGEIARAIELTVDITERRRVEDAVYFQAMVLDQINDLVTVTDLDGIITYINDAESRFMKCDKEKIIGRSVEVYGDDPERGATQREIVERTRTQGEWRGEVINYSSDGREIILDCRTKLIRGRDGKPTGMVGISTDISARKSTEEAIKKSEARMRGILDNIPEIIIQVDKELKVLWANSTVLSMNNDIMGRTCHKALMHQEEPCRGCPVLECFSTGRIEKKMMHQGEVESLQGESWWRTTGIPLRNVKEEITGTIAISRNITEERRVEEERQQAHKMEAIGTLAGGIAHDFNNMLGVILGNTKLMLEDCPDEGELRWSAEQVKEAALKARDLVRQILTFSRSSKQKMNVLHLAPLVKESLKLLRATIPTTIEFSLKIDCPNDSIIGDPIQINQVLMNLCVNAEHAMRGSGGILEVRLHNRLIKSDEMESPVSLEPGEYVDLQVEDNGCGIDPEIIDRVFDPFFTTKDVDLGTGLGLSVVHGIVKNHHGAITVQSKVGKGSTFTVLFPVAAVEEEDNESSEAPMKGGSERILLIDDEEQITKITGVILTKLGYKTVSFRSSEKALKEFKESPDSYDLVITDMTMPRMTGKMLAKEILKIRPDTPIILCTGYSDLVSERDCRREGISAVLMKPYDRRELSETIREVLDG